MSPRDLRRFLAAPELLVVDVADATLVTLLRAIAVEHPALDHEPPRDEAPVRHRARAILRPARSLRRALAAYRRAVDRLVDDLHRDDLPF